MKRSRRRQQGVGSNAARVRVSGEDDVAEERPPEGTTRTFPHILGTPGGKPDAMFYERCVPVILFGAPVRAGQYTQPATPADIAPTLAAVAHVPIAKTDGRVLTAALVNGEGGQGRDPLAPARGRGGFDQ
jgi:hypothetical protein